MFWIIVFNSFILSAHADFSSQHCLNVDYTNRFGPIRDQDGHGYCWAFQASALAEEALCKKDKKICGRSISPLDISRCDWKLTAKKEGGDGYTALKCGRDYGVCMEEKAPYDALMSWGCSMKELFLLKSSKCDREIVKSYYTEWKKLETKCSSDDIITTTELNQLRVLEQQISEKIRAKIPANVLAGKNIGTLLRNSPNSMEFLKHTLISKSCEETRIKVPGQLHFLPEDASDFSSKNIRKVLEVIHEGLRNNSSVAISIDLGRTKLNKKFFNQLTAYPKNSFHGLVINGMRFNTKSNKCEVHLRNSWGKGADFNGWTSVSDIEAGLMDGYFIK